MPAGLLIRLRPTGPLRIGPDSGVRDRVDRIFHSDALYSAVSQAMLQLGMLDAWLEDTVRVVPPAVRFGSCFPYFGGPGGETLLVTPPRTLWPPPWSAKVRWKGARFVPLSVVETLAMGQPLRDDQWMVDGESECLLPQRAPGGAGPFRVTVRSNAAMDRGGEGLATHSTACMEFAHGSGLWTVAQFSDNAARDRWTGPLTSAFRLLADTGIGGERSRGWGRLETPQITSGHLPGLLLKRLPGKTTKESGYWLLSLFHPGLTDVVDWQQGNYALVQRGGRVESHAGWGQAKQATRMVTEGSVLVSSEEPAGIAPDVAPEGFAHPVYRAGFALTIQIPLNPTDRVAKPDQSGPAAPIIVAPAQAAPVPTPEPGEDVEVEEQADGNPIDEIPLAEEVTETPAAEESLTTETPSELAAGKPSAEPTAAEPGETESAE